MRWPGLILCSLLLLVMAGCRKNEFEVDFNLSKDVTANYRLVYLAASPKQSMVVEMTAVVSGGKCSLTLPGKYPAVVWVVQGSGASPLLAFYAEKGDKIEITGDDGNPAKWKVGGNDINEQWTRWRIDNAKSLDQVKTRNEAVAGYVEKNPESVLSTILLLTTYSRAEDPQGFERLWGRLKGAALDDRVRAAVGRSDMLAPSATEQARMKPFRLYVIGDTVVDVAFDKSKSTMLYFWGGGDNSTRMAMADSLEKLHKECPDSAGYQIIDISVERDSTSWTYLIRNDSVTLSRRGWAAAGVMNPELRQFHIGSVPLFMVIDRKGMVKYRGTRFHDAKEILKKKQSDKKQTN